MIGWGIAPCVLWHQGGANLLKLLILKDALWRALNVDLVSGIEKCLGCSWSEGGAMLERLAFAFVSK